MQAWLFTICRSIWLNDLRKAAIRKSGSLIGTEDIADLISPSETNIFARQVLSHVMSLPEAQRETVLLVYVEECTYRETAAVLDVPIGTVMSHLAAARKKLAPLQDQPQGKEART